MVQGSGFHGLGLRESELKREAYTVYGFMVVRFGVLLSTSVVTSSIHSEIGRRVPSF